jgi:tetratricopeptide (TPR) repeat protein
VQGFQAQRPVVCAPGSANASRRRRGVGFAGLTALLLVAGLALTGCGSSSSASSSTTAPGPPKASAVATLINSGIAQADAKQYQQAQTTFRDVLVVSPRNKFAWFNLGLIAQVLNRASEAVADYSRAVSTDPTYTPAMYNKAILLERTNLHSALALYQRITSINPKAATAYLRESFVYSRLGDKTKANQARARAIALDSKLATVTASAQ